MIIRLTNTIGAIGRRLGIVTKNLQMWLGFYKSEIIGKDLVVNGDFATDSDWTKQAGWTISGGVANVDSSVAGSTNITSTNLTLTIGSTYDVEYYVDSASGIGVASTVGGVGESVFSIATGNRVRTIVATSTQGFILSASGSTTLAQISNVTVKEVTQFVKDKSTNSNDAKLFTGKALSFNGNDYVDCGVIDAINSDVVSVAFWSKVDSGANMLNSNILGSMTSGGAWGTLLVRFSNNTTFKVLWNNAYSKSVTIPDVRDGAWHRYVVVRSGSGSNLSLDIYIDGVSVSTVVGTYTSNFSIGRGGDYNGGYLRGEVSDVEVYDAKLELDDVVFDYANPNHLVTDNPNTTLTLSNLSAYYALSEGSGNKIYDSTGLGAELVENGDFEDGFTSWANGSAWSIVSDAAHLTNSNSATNSTLTSNSTLISTSSYKATYTITDYVSGELALVVGNVSIPSTNGTHTVTFDGATSFSIKRKGGATDLTIDNISVKEVKADDGTAYDQDGAVIGATWVDQQPTIPQLGLMDWSKGNNLIPFSEDFSEFTNNNSTTSLNTISSPLGDITADTIISNTSSTFSGVYEGVNSISAGDYTFSVWLKSSNITALSLRLRADSTQLAVENITITSDWVRYSITATAPITSVFQTHVFLNADGISGTSNVGDEVYIWGAQLEESSTVGSYIGTNGLAASNATLVQNPNDKGKDVLGNSLRLRERGFNLDGTGYAEVADDDSLDFGTGDFSIEMWAKFAFLHKGSSWNSAVSLGGSVVSTTSSALATKSGKFYFNIGGTTTVSSTPTLVEGQWYHVVGTRTGTTMRLYIDSAVETSTSTSSQTVTNANVKKIGDDTDHSYDRHYEDLIDEVRLYNRALTQKEITNNRKVGLSSHKVGSAFSTEFSSEFGF